MGAWDSGLYDNDYALDKLAVLLDELDAEGGPDSLATAIALRAWLNAPAPTAAELRQLLERHRAWLDELPPPAREALVALEAAGDTQRRERSRTAEVTAVLGRYCDGPRLSTLLALPGSAAIIEGLVRRAAEQLDVALAAAHDLYDGCSAGAYVGVLLELSTAGYGTVPASSVARWRGAVARLDEATVDDRESWDEYVARFVRGLALLERR